jgi:hypothetical protein
MPIEESNPNLGGEPTTSSTLESLGTEVGDNSSETEIESNGTAEDGAGAAAGEISADEVLADGLLAKLMGDGGEPDPLDAIQPPKPDAEGAKKPIDAMYEGQVEHLVRLGLEEDEAKAYVEAHRQKFEAYSKSVMDEVSRAVAAAVGPVLPALKDARQASQRAAEAQIDRELDAWSGPRAAQVGTAGKATKAQVYFRTVLVRTAQDMYRNMPANARDQVKAAQFFDLAYPVALRKAQEAGLRLTPIEAQIASGQKRVPGSLPAAAAATPRKVEKPSQTPRQRAAETLKRTRQRLGAT